MEDIVCDISAFRFHRTPPQVLLAYDELPVGRDRSARMALADQPLVCDILGTPLHLLVFDAASRTRSKRIVRHLWQEDPPAGSIVRHDLLDGVTSPLFTLFLLARSLPFNRLVMAMFEFCGTFSVFKPTDPVESYLSRQGLNDALGWSRVHDGNGRPTNLWRRPPLVEIPDLLAFAENNVSRYGGSTFRKAALQVTGVTASPLEVQATMLLGMSRCLGGAGLRPLENNKPVDLTRGASNIARKHRCYADIYLSSPDGTREVIVECQGKVVHANETALEMDADRTAALESMGYAVHLLSWHQIRDKASFDTVVGLLAKKLCIRMTPKTARMLEKERQLRRDIFMDWAELGRNA